MKVASILVLLLIHVLVASGQVSEADHFFPIETSHSYIEFSVKYMGYAKVKGRFADFSGMIYYDDQDISKMSATISAKVESIDTDIDFRDNDLKSDNWFDARQFPMINFQSKRSVATAEGFDVTGDLTMKGITKEVTIHMNKPSGVVKDARSDVQVILTGAARINRIDYKIEGKNWSGIKEGITAVEDNVDLEFSLLAKQIKKDNFKYWVGSVEQPAGKLYAIVKDQGVKAAITEFDKMKAANALKEFALIDASYMLQLEGRGQEAISLLEVNRNAFPDRSLVYQQLGMAYLRAGNRQKAKENFQMSREKDPGNSQVDELLRHF